MGNHFFFFDITLSTRPHWCCVRMWQIYTGRLEAKKSHLCRHLQCLCGREKAWTVSKKGRLGGELDPRPDERNRPLRMSSVASMHKEYVWATATPSTHFLGCRGCHKMSWYGSWAQVVRLRATDAPRSRHRGIQPSSEPGMYFESHKGVDVVLHLWFMPRWNVCMWMWGKNEMNKW